MEEGLHTFTHRRMLVGALLTVIAVGLGTALVPLARATPPQGPVTIMTAIDFSTFPFHGTFQVTDGSGLLGCTAGTFLDTPLGGIGTEVEKSLTCTGGAGTGDGIGIVFDGAIGDLSRGNAIGHWRVVEGTGSFASLRGEGEFSVVFCFGPDPCPGFLPPPSGIETITGSIH